MAEMKKQTLDAFEKQFGYIDGVEVYFAPGRVNLIGEHTDYNGGHVFPCALTIGTYMAVRKRNDSLLRFYSVNFPDEGIIESSISDFHPCEEHSWIAYPKGVMWVFNQRGMKMDTGLDIVVNGNIPNGSGLSSSASLEVLAGFMLKEQFGFDVDNVELAKIGQYSENNYNGCNCGIMDQFASAMGKENNAIFLDTATLKYEYAPIVLDGMKIVVTNSKVKHSLVTSAYNDRRSSCEMALSEIQEGLQQESQGTPLIKTLGDLSEADFEVYKHYIKDPDRVNKAKHAVYENQRTIKAVQALSDGDIVRFGKLMNQSHVSLRDDYDVSCPEIDVLVDAAWNVPGVIGSRITGGGFGGCTVSIVKEDAVEEFKEKLVEAYKEKCGMVPEFYVVSIGDGPRRL